MFRFGPAGGRQRKVKGRQSRQSDQKRCDSVQQMAEKWNEDGDQKQKQRQKPRSPTDVVPGSRRKTFLRHKNSLLSELGHHQQTIQQAIQQAKASHPPILARQEPFDASLSPETVAQAVAPLPSHIPPLLSPPWPLSSGLVWSKVVPGSP